MLGWAVTFLIIALIAALLGFGGIAGVAIEAAKIVFFVAIALFAISLIAGLVRARTPTVPKSGIFDSSAGSEKLRTTWSHGAFLFGDFVGPRRNIYSPPLAKTARVVSSGPKSSALLTCSNSASRVRARLTRDLIVPTAQPQMPAASSYENPDAPTRIRASR